MSDQPQFQVAAAGLLGQRCGCAQQAAAIHYPSHHQCNIRPLKIPLSGFYFLVMYLHSITYSITFNQLFLAAAFPTGFYFLAMYLFIGASFEFFSLGALFYAAYR